MRISDWSSDVCSSDLIPMIQSHAKIVALMALAGGLSMVNAHAGTFPDFGFAPPKSEYSGPAFQLSQSYPTTAPGAASMPAFFKILPTTRSNDFETWRAYMEGVKQYCLEGDRKSTRMNSSH